MPLSPADLVPVPGRSEVATGPVVAVGQDSVSVSIRPGVTVVVPAKGYAVGEMVVVSMPHGRLAGSQILGRAAGTRAPVRQVVI